MNRDDEIARDEKDAARYRFLRDYGHLDYMEPGANKKVPKRTIDRITDRWMRMRGGPSAGQKHD